MLHLLDHDNLTVGITMDHFFDLAGGPQWHPLFPPLLRHDPVSVTR